MRTLFAALAFAFLLTLAGCGKKVEKTPMKMEDVPPEIMKVAKETLPADVTISEAYKEGPNYELRGKDKKGKLHEVDITPEGKVVKD